jgi:hypothetical protein
MQYAVVWMPLSFVWEDNSYRVNPQLKVHGLIVDWVEAAPNVSFIK